MIDKTSGLGSGGAAAQAAGILLGLGALAFSPPAVGPMLLIPLGDVSRAGIVSLAVAGGARLVAPGPLAAWLIVYGDHARLKRAVGESGVLVLAAPFAGCGKGAA